MTEVFGPTLTSGTLASQHAPSEASRAQRPEPQENRTVLYRVDQPHQPFKPDKAGNSQEPRIDPHTLAGPPPAFKVSLLKLDLEMQTALARLNASHTFGAGAFQSESKPVGSETNDPVLGESKAPDPAEVKHQQAKEQQQHDDIAQSLSDETVTAHDDASLVHVPLSLGETA